MGAGAGFVPPAGPSAREAEAWSHHVLALERIAESVAVQLGQARSHATLAAAPVSPGPPPWATPRLRSCVEQWPECVDGEYNPKCCRWPKSCSCTTYDEKTIRPVDLEERP